MTERIELNLNSGDCALFDGETSMRSSQLSEAYRELFCDAMGPRAKSGVVSITRQDVSDDLWSFLFRAVTQSAETSELKRPAFDETNGGDYVARIG